MALSSSSKCSSSSSSFASCKYDVFLSFRGEDTRDNFTSHLDYALCRSKLKMFIDEELKRGDEISPALLNAIQTSKISVIIFSKTYASSRWCLDELVKILECHKMNGQIVIPVFYHVHPSDVRKQTGSFGNAFVELAKRFKKTPEKVHKWRAVLTEASNLSGWDSMKIKPEARLIDEIVKDILKKLKDKSFSSDFNGLVGLNPRIEEIISLLGVGFPDFRIVGIWGMGGIGKTTLAGAIYNKISFEFEGKCFMANVRKASEEGGGLLHLRDQVLSHVLAENVKIGTPDIPQNLKERLKQMKVFIVLDDVNRFGQLECLAGGLDRFGPGSRIIVTTRDKKVLDKYGVENIYKVKEFNENEGLQLLCNFAFGQNYGPKDLMALSMEVIDYAKGNPLALKVLGSFFHGKSKSDWENTLHNLKWISDPEIYDVLKISYDELNWDVKNIFLDIACFFRGDDEDHVISVSDDPCLMRYGLGVLVEKSLVTISNKKLEMHDLLQEMGQEIVRQESQEEPGKRSRLWDPKDVCRVLQKNKGTDSIKGIFLNLSKIRDIHLDPRVFANMSNLRILKFYMPEHFDVWDISSKVHLLEGLEYFPDELRYLHWHEYPLATLPINFSPDNLTYLSLPYSQVQQLWEGKKEAIKLQFIDLQHSHYLTRIPNPSETPNVERINLSGCINFSRIPSSIQNFDKLSFLCFRKCENFRSFPPNIHFKSRIIIDLSFCINLTKFPEISGNIIDLDLRYTAIKEVPSSIVRLNCLESLNLRGCRLISISTRVCELKSLCSITLSLLSKFERLWGILEQLESFQYVWLVWNELKELRCSIEFLIGRKQWSPRPLFDRLEQQWDLKTLILKHGDESSISLLSSSITFLNKLESVHFFNCRGLVLPPLSGLSNLKELKLSHSDITEIPQDIGCLSSLKILDLEMNSFESLPTSIKHLSQLRFLYLYGCVMLQSLPELPPLLEVLDASNCKRLKSLPELPECLGTFDASPLETLSQSPNSFCSDRILYLFKNCPKLKAKNILADSQLAIQHMAIALLKQFNFHEKTPAGFHIYLSGSRIPEWFSNRSSGSSITIQLPQHSCNRNFIGFALCAVFGSDGNSDDTDLRFKVNWRYRFENNWRYRFEKNTPSATDQFGATNLSKCTFIWADEVFIGFDPCWNVRLPDGNHRTAVSIDFSTIYDGLPEECSPKVKCCGVCPMYAHPNKTQPNTFTVNMMPPTEDEYTQIMKAHNDFNDKARTSGSITRSDEAEVEPHCRPDQINDPQHQSSSFSQYFHKTKNLVAGLFCSDGLKGRILRRKRGSGTAEEEEEPRTKRILSCKEQINAP